MAKPRVLTSKRLVQAGVLALSVMFHGSTFAQNAPEDSEGIEAAIEQLEAQGKGRDAIPLARKLLAQREAEPNTDVDSLTYAIYLLARAHELAGQYAQALPLYERSLTIREKALGPDHPDVATSLNNLAGLYVSMGQYAQALPLYQRDLSISEKALGPDHPDVATSLNNLAGLYQKLGQTDQVLPLRERAAEIVSSAQNPETKFWVQSGLSDALSTLNRPDEAIYWGKQAVNTIQSMRAGLTALSSDMQKGFLEGKRVVYANLSDRLIAQGRIAEAQRVMDLLKQEEYFDFVRRDPIQAPSKAQMVLNGLEKKADERGAVIQKDLARLGAQKRELALKKKNGIATPQELAQLEQVDQALGEARARFTVFLGDLRKMLAGDGVKQAGTDQAVSQIQTHRTVLNALGPERRDRTATLQFIASEKQLHIILTTTTIQNAYVVNISNAELNTKVAALRTALQNKDVDPSERSREMYQLLIAPAMHDLCGDKRADGTCSSGINAIMLYLDGTLRYLPFAALLSGDGKADPGQYLLAQFQLSVYTAAAATSIATAPQSQWQVSAMGVTIAYPSFVALDAVEGELKGIVRKDVLPGEIMLNEQFTQESFKSALSRPVVHVASHFRFEPGSDASYLLLGDGSGLSLQTLRQDDVRFDDVDLLTLSACETAMGGGKNENGLEVEGLGALAQLQGAKAVMATLWSVADASTGVLMQQFYRIHEGKKGTTKAEALRQAQLAMLHGGLNTQVDEARRGVTRPTPRSAEKPALVDPKRPYAHPYYWAPFILMGNWL